MPPLSPFSKSCVALAVSQLMLSSQASNAATITVDSNADDNGVGCTLREAIVSANTDVDQGNGCAVGSVSGTDTITFNNSNFTSNTITLIGGGETTSSDGGEGGEGSPFFTYGDGLYISNKDIEINASTISGGITIDANQSRAIYVGRQPYIPDGPDGGPYGGPDGGPYGGPDGGPYIPYIPYLEPLASADTPNVSSPGTCLLYTSPSPRD